jgi:hypothetical protein
MNTVHIVAADFIVIGWNTILIIHKYSEHFFSSEHLIKRFMHFSYFPTMLRSMHILISSIISH